MQSNWVTSLGLMCLDHMQYLMYFNILDLLINHFSINYKLSPFQWRHISHCEKWDIYTLQPPILTITLISRKANILPSSILHLCQFYATYAHCIYSNKLESASKMVRETSLWLEGQIRLYWAASRLHVGNFVNVISQKRALISVKLSWIKINFKKWSLKKWLNSVFGILVHIVFEARVRVCL